jgi:L-cysteine S-thiosulfotransferase
MTSISLRFCLLAVVVTAGTVSFWRGAVADDESAAAHVTDAAVETVMRKSFAGVTPDQWRTRVKQDEVQRLCSRYQNKPPPAAAKRILELSGREFRYPSSGNLLGDWKNGEKLASSGKGGHIGTIRPDPPGRKRGANCYACHALAPSELSAGNLGPGLTGYGKLHGTSPESIERVYQKIYNAQASYPCSQMPRFGHNQWLTPEEVADAVAFLLDPDSPVNQ